MLGNGVTKGDAPVRPVPPAELSTLTAQLQAAAGGNDAAKIEPSRVGAAYRLAIGAQRAVLAAQRSISNQRVAAKGRLVVPLGGWCRRRAGVAGGRLRERFGPIPGGPRQGTAAAARPAGRFHPP